MRFTHTRAYVREQNLLRKGRILFKRRGLPIVAYAMFRLNRTAQILPRYATPKAQIYALKNLLVEHLYASGYCVGVSKQFQVLKCHACDGTGEDSWNDYEFCFRCDGTGIYKTIPLYLFRFQVGDTFYSWHQPVGLVTWNVNLTTSDAKDYAADEHKNIVPVTGARFALCMSVIAAYLMAQGVNVKVQHRTLGYSLYLDLFARPQYQLRYRIEILRWNVREKIDALLRSRKRADADEYQEQEAQDYVEWSREQARAGYLEREREQTDELPF